MRAVLTILRFVALTTVALPLALFGWALSSVGLGFALVANWIQENA